MEITRKTANKIVDLLIAKEISDRDARELSNQICELLEWEQLIGTQTWVPNLAIWNNVTVPTPVFTPSFVTPTPVISETVPLESIKAKLPPNTKYHNWYTDEKWKFFPCDMSRLWWVTWLNWKPDYELMSLK